MDEFECMRQLCGRDEMMVDVGGNHLARKLIDGNPLLVSAAHPLDVGRPDVEAFSLIPWDNQPDTTLPVASCS